MPSEPFWTKAIILSLLLHLVVARLFIFVWPLKKENLKPEIVFFGAIVEKSELSDFTTREMDQRVILRPKHVTYQPSHTRAPYANREVTKPAYPDATPKLPKAVPKVSYMTDPVQKKKEETSPAATPFVSETPQYQPLRLNPK